MNTPNIVEGKKYYVGSPQSVLVQVISGTPVMEFSLDDFTTSSVVDLSSATSYPSVEVKLPTCHYRFVLSGAQVKVTGLKD